MYTPDIGEELCDSVVTREFTAFVTLISPKTWQRMESPPFGKSTSIPFVYNSLARFTALWCLFTCQKLKPITALFAFHQVHSLGPSAKAFGDTWKVPPVTYHTKSFELRT